LWTPEGRKRLGRLRPKYGDNIKTDIKEIRREGVEWIDLSQGRDKWQAVVNTAMNLLVS
jgi:ribosome recycling factor